MLELQKFYGSEAREPRKKVKYLFGKCGVVDAQMCGVSIQYKSFLGQKFL